MTLSTQESLFPELLVEQKLTSFENTKQWLGFTLGHRQLFQALEYDYLLLDSLQGIRLGINCYAFNHEQIAPEYNIQVYIKVSPSLLPNISLTRPGVSIEPTVPLAKALVQGTVITWAYILPISTFIEIAVEDGEQLSRLIGLAKSASNISLPCKTSINSSLKSKISIASPSLEYRKDLGSILKNFDSYRGAVSMALWGIPRVEPWIQSVLQSLAKTEHSRHELHPSIPGWMRHLPWNIENNHNDAYADDPEICLWINVVRELTRCDCNYDFNPSEFVKNCTNFSSSSALLKDSGFRPVLDYLSERTQLMLSGRAGININDQRVLGIGLALQLFVLRPKPDQYKTWIVDYPDLSPPAWVAGLILCGLLNGYHLLPCEYRSITKLKSGSNHVRFRDLLLLHFLSCEAGDSLDASWPLTPVESPLVSLDGSDLVLTWDGITIGVRHASERMAWLVADFSDPQILKRAKYISRRLRWPCTTAYLTLPPGRYQVDGTALIPGEGSFNSKYLIVNECDFRIQLPDSAALSNILDIELFCHHLLAVGGDFKQAGIKELTPIIENRIPSRHQKAAISNPISYELLQIAEISGLFIFPNYINAAEEQQLLNMVDAGTWSYAGIKNSSRRVQHFGWVYNYKSRNIKPSDYIGPLPEWAELLAQRLYRERLMPFVADQLIINEYTSGQGISPHTDSPESFRDTIVSISLIESWTMQFSRRLKGQAHPVLMPARSALVLSGESRSAWLHEIRKRKRDESGQIRNRRVSLTFRKINSHWLAS